MGKLGLGILALLLAFLLACDEKATPTPTMSAIPVATPTPFPIPTHTPTPVPTDTPTPLPTSTPTPIPPTATPTPTPAPVRKLSATPAVRDLYALTARLVTKDGKPIPRVVNATPETFAVGRLDSFQVTDIPNGTVHKVNATLSMVTEHAYWYVDARVTFSMSDLQRAADGFEQRIYPRLTAVFGPELTPGIDNDVHLTILHTPLAGVAGYFSAADEYTVQVHQQSNQREMLYIDTSALPLGSDAYLGTLAHEFTHAIQFRVDPDQDSWFNEGMAEYGKRLAGYPPSFQATFFSNPPVSFSVWPLEIGSTAPYYGAASLLMDYLAQQFGADTMLTLMAEQSRGVEAIRQYLADIHAGRSWRQVFADWTVANYLDDPKGGPYSSPANGILGFQPKPLSAAATVSETLPQYAERYYQLPAGQTVKVAFNGRPQTPLLTDPPPSGDRCWWSNAGDSIDSTLTGHFDLPARKPLSLDYSLWMDLEERWDFAYVEASIDGGQTWDMLKGGHTVPPDNLHNAFGEGYTGKSGGWLQDTVDLTPYAGKPVLLRFEYVTDDAIHGAGLCLDDITIKGVGFYDDAESDAGVWDSEGFARASYQTPQEFLLRLVQVKGDVSTVQDIPVDADGSATFTVGSQSADKSVLVAAAMNDGTLMPASFQLRVGPP